MFSLRRNLRRTTQLQHRPNGTEYSPIYRLPPELLSEIFILCQDGTWSGDIDHCFFDDLNFHHNNLYQNISKCHRWIIITQVCSRWRQVALNTPRLWSFININTAVFARKCSMVRVKEAPLHLVLPLSPWYSKDQSALFRELIPHFRRVQSIVIRPSNDDLGLARVSRLPSMIFVSQSVRNSRNPNLGIPEWPKDSSFPVIRMLEVEDYITSLPEYLLGTTLTKLILRANSTAPQSVDAATFMRSLSRMSQLEVLWLDGVHLQTEDDEAIVNAPTILLPSLEQIVIKAGYTHTTELLYAAFIALLRVPSTTHYDFQFSCSDPESVSLIHSALLPSLSLFDLKGLSIILDRQEYTSSFWTDAVDLRKLVNAKSTPSTANLSLYLFDAFSEYTWDHFVGRLDLKGLQTLFLGDSGPHSGFDVNIETLWPRIVPQCLNLKSLGIQGDRARNLVRLLSGQGEPSNLTMILPELEAIAFSDVQWRTLDEMHDDQSRFKESLISLLTQRARTLRTVIIKKCRNMDEMDVKELASMGLHVEWDRYKRIQVDQRDVVVELDSDGEGACRYLSVSSSGQVDSDDDYLI